MTDKPHSIADTLFAIEAEMRHLGLWRSEYPSQAALSSQTPFCYDTLEFCEWLQWVFLPRMKELIEQNRPLPTQSDIHPMAEYKLESACRDINRLLSLIKRFDELVCLKG